MARRRMIDPHFWESDDVAQLTIFERLLFIGMISNADDFGKGQANPMFLRSKIFPYDDISTNDIETALEKVKRHMNIMIYEVNEKKYYKLNKWNEWQNVPHPTKSTIPDPFKNDSRTIQESFKNDSGNETQKSPYKRKESKLNINKKEIYKEKSWTDETNVAKPSVVPNDTTPCISAKPVEDFIKEPELQTDTNQNQNPENKNGKIPYAEIIDLLNLLVKTNYQHTAKQTRRFIQARFHDGFTKEDFFTVIRKMSVEWGSDPKMRVYLRPETLFGNKFESYLNRPEKFQKSNTNSVIPNNSQKTPYQLPETIYDKCEMCNGYYSQAWHSDIGRYVCSECGSDQRDVKKYDNPEHRERIIKYEPPTEPESDDSWMDNCVHLR